MRPLEPNEIHVIRAKISHAYRVQRDAGFKVNMKELVGRILQEHGIANDVELNRSLCRIMGQRGGKSNAYRRSRQAPQSPARSSPPEPPAKPREPLRFEEYLFRDLFQPKTGHR